MFEFITTEGKTVYIRLGYLLAIYENDDGVWSVWLGNGHAHNVTRETAERLVKEIRESEGESWR